MEGDRTGTIHLGFNQTFLSLQSHLPMGLVIYQGGLTTMQGELRVAGVTVEVGGVLRRCQNITVVDGGAIYMREMYNTLGNPTRVSCFWMGKGWDKELWDLNMIDSFEKCTLILV